MRPPPAASDRTDGRRTWRRTLTCPVRGKNEHVITMRRPSAGTHWLVTHRESITHLLAMMTRGGSPGSESGRSRRRMRACRIDPPVAGGQARLPSWFELNTRRRGGHGHLLRLPSQPADGSKRPGVPPECLAGSYGADLLLTRIGDPFCSSDRNGRRISVLAWCSREGCLNRGSAARASCASCSQSPQDRGAAFMDLCGRCLR